MNEVSSQNGRKKSGQRDLGIPHWVRACHICGIILTVLGFGLSMCVNGFTFPLFPSTVELPSSRIHAIALDSQGRIYTYSQYTYRLQVYSPQGEFIRGFSSHGLSACRIDSQGHLRGVGGNWVFTYTLDGDLLRKERYDPDVHGEEFYARGDERITDASGNTYGVMPWPMIWPRVEKVSSSGNRVIVISQPLWMWLIQSPFPVFVYIFCGIGLYWTWYFVERRYNKRFVAIGCDKSDVVKKG